MKTIAMLDTSIASTNLGDSIIMDSIRETLFELYSDAFYVYFQTHDVISKPSYRLINQCGLRFLGGTNLLSSNMDRYNQWKITLWSSLFMKNIILLGVGWWQYQNAPNLYTRILLNKVLSKDYSITLLASRPESLGSKGASGKVKFSEDSFLMVKIY